MTKEERKQKYIEEYTAMVNSHLAKLYAKLSKKQPLKKTKEIEFYIESWNKRLATYIEEINKGDIE